MENVKERSSSYSGIACPAEMSVRTNPDGRRL